MNDKKPIPKKSDRIDLIKLRNHLDNLDLSNNDDLNFWLYCMVAQKTGLRSVDILKMKVNSINFEDRTVNVIEQKTKRKVQILLHSDVLKRIDKTKEYIIWNTKYSTTVSLMTINRRLKRVFKDDNINVSSHSIRKAVARSIYEQTKNDLVSAMTFLGHKNPSTTITYLEIDKDKLDSLYKLLEW